MEKRLEERYLVFSQLCFILAMKNQIGNTLVNSLGNKLET